MATDVFEEVTVGAMLLGVVTLKMYELEDPLKV